MPNRFLSKLKGQVFTPPALCDWMIALAATVAQPKTCPVILDIGCGNGIFLERMASFLAYQFPQVVSQQAYLWGVDADPEAVAQAQGQLQDRAQIQSADFLSDTYQPAILPDWILGNPPYLRRESHGKHQPPQWLAYYDAYVASYPEQRTLISMANDLYVLFLLRATQLLQPGGTLAVVISNSWLGTRFGERLLQFLRHHYQIKLLMGSDCERWFPDAAIHAVVLVATRKQADFSEASNTTVLPCTALTQSLAQVVSQPVDWHALLVKAKAWFDQQAIERYSSRRYFGGNVFERLVPYQQPLGELATVHYTVKTGLNAFFYVEQSTVDRFGIEPEFLVPVVKSLRQIDCYQLNDQETSNWFLVCCGLSPEALQAQGKTGMLAYIAWGAEQLAPTRQKRAQSVRWPEVASLQQRPYWYTCSPPQQYALFCSRFFDQRYVFPVTERPVALDQTFYGLQIERNSLQLMGALLNSTLSYLMVEQAGQANLGEGVLQFSRENMAHLPVLRPDLFSAVEQDVLMAHYAQLRSRRLYKIDEELRQPDRQALDTLVVEKIQGLSVGAVYDQLLSCLGRRLKAAARLPVK